jgi:F-type H+-transporting ATPase subunit alpha
MRDKHADVLDAIRTEKAISDATMPKLKSAVETYAKSFA